MSLMRPGALLLIRVHPSDQERLSPRVCIRKEILSQNSIWKWNDTVHTIRRGERGVQVNMSMSLGQLVLLHSSLSENVNQMVSDHVWPGCYIQKKTLPLFGSAVSRGLITFNFKSILSGIQRKKKKKKNWLEMWKQGICQSSAFLTTTEIRCSILPSRGNRVEDRTCNTK